jgi:hypothetical protein
MYEVYSNGKVPYADKSTEAVREAVIKGLKLQVPIECPEKIQPWVLKCWEMKPSDRPSFVELLQGLAPVLVDETSPPVTMNYNK